MKLISPPGDFSFSLTLPGAAAGRHVKAAWSLIELNLQPVALDVQQDAWKMQAHLPRCFASPRQHPAISCINEKNPTRLDRGMRRYKHPFIGLFTVTWAGGTHLIA